MQAADLLELRDDLKREEQQKTTQNGQNPAAMTSFQQLRQQRHNQFITELKSRLQRLISTNTIHPRPDQVYLFGSRARGDWDGHSDTDLLVVAATRKLANQWVDLLLDAERGADVVGLDQEGWKQLPQHTNVIWRHVARDAQPLLEPEA